MTPDQLHRFCARSDDRRAPLRAPWRFGAHIYATNGHIAVQLPDDGRECIDAADGTGHPLNIATMFSDNLRKGYFALPELPSKKVCGLCMLCDGKTVARIGKCPDCDGEGEFRHGSHVYECQECETSGEAVCDKFPEVECTSCHGTGERNRHGIDVGDGHFATHYLRWIAALPGAAVSTAGEAKPLVFKFDGGRGLLMSRRRD